MPSVKLEVVGRPDGSAADLYLEANGQRWRVGEIIKSEAVTDPVALARLLAAAPEFARFCGMLSVDRFASLPTREHVRLCKALEDAGATSLETAGVSRDVVRCSHCASWGPTLSWAFSHGIPCPVCGRMTYPNEGVNMEVGSSVCHSGGVYDRGLLQVLPKGTVTQLVSYIVELEPGVYLAEGDGDPPRTTLKRYARCFASVSAANRGMRDARRFRKFEDAVVASYYPEGT